MKRRGSGTAGSTASGIGIDSDSGIASDASRDNIGTSGMDG